MDTAETISVSVSGKQQVSLAEEIVGAAHRRLRWEGGYDRPLNCGLSKGGGCYKGRFLVYGTITCAIDDCEALEAIAADAAKYWQARSKPGLAKSADAIRSALAEKRINAGYLATFNA